MPCQHCSPSICVSWANSRLTDLFGPVCVWDRGNEQDLWFCMSVVNFVCCVWGGWVSSDIPSSWIWAIEFNRPIGTKVSLNFCHFFILFCISLPQQYSKFCRWKMEWVFSHFQSLTLPVTLIITCEKDYIVVRDHLFSSSSSSIYFLSLIYPRVIQPFWLQSSSLSEVVASKFWCALCAFLKSTFHFH